MQPSALKPNEEMIGKAHDIVSKDSVLPAGYIVKIYPLGADTRLKAGERAKYQKLAELGFEATTSDQAARETKGSEMAIVVAIGEGAWGDPRLGGKPIVKVGQVIKYRAIQGMSLKNLWAVVRFTD